MENITHIFIMLFVFRIEKLKMVIGKKWSGKPVPDVIWSCF